MDIYNIYIYAYLFWYAYILIIYLEPALKTSIFEGQSLKTLMTPNQGLNSNQDKGHFGFQVYTE